VFAVLLRGVVCKRFFCVPSLSSPGAGLLVRRFFGHLFIYLFIFVSSTEPSSLSVMGALVGAWHRGLVAGLQVGAGQLGVPAPWGVITDAAPWPLGHLTSTCDERVNNRHSY